MSLQYVFPTVTSATISPNPVDMNTVFKLSVTVMERIVELDSESIFSNEIHSGEMT